MGKYIWEMLHTISQSWNITRKFYNEETWPTHWKMKPIFFLKASVTFMCSTEHYVLGLVQDFWILASACY